MAHEGTFFSAFLLGPRRQAERRLERFHIMLTKRALSAEWEKSSGSFSGGLLYAGGKFSFSRFRSRFWGKNDVFRRLYGQKNLWLQDCQSLGQEFFGRGGALRMCVAVSR